MGMDAGAGGAFGLLLSDYEQPAIKAVLAALSEYIDTARETGATGSDGDGEEDEYDFGLHDPDEFPRVGEFAEQFVRAFAETGIVVPPTVQLYWSGREYDRPARCDTPTEEWVLGFGLFTQPWDYPPMDESFREAADFHTWVWMG